MANSHYISRFLTKPWEHEKRRITYYDFRRKKFYVETSKRLYAKEGLFSDNLEAFLNKKIEHITEKEREALAQGRTDYADFKTYRAIVLLVALQGGRSAARQTNSVNFERILSFTDTQLDQLTLAIQQQFRLVSLMVSPSLRLYYPETGVFAALVQDAGPRWIICLPLTPTCALALVPIDVDVKSTQQLTSDGSLMNWSVGANPYCQRVVVHPDLIKHHSEATLGEAIEKTRQDVDTLITNVEHYNRAVESANQEIERMFGFRPADL